ncbi:MULTISPECIES: porin [Paraburkholderia]|jgi:predicted porin|uniref:Porin n=1 Tax=Paraburkholderia caribensis TaxID=75105 RepID=A0A9Q6S683_9BURK|nr:MULTISPECIES: porin [Paraburkholderia]ALP64939.1 porin [Paraburkholderia caribensis]AMV44713.1 porin [Paraburkholderia caribensis]AUT53913.1 porin [Paraburkholderia caribensis]MCO4882798.1 porin [Paraburkholderia caribensis]PTB30658.1 porin [Paraburkholderia caribensis]
MKRIALSTLSLALLGAAGAAHAQSSVTLYGLIDDSIQYVHNANPANDNLWQLAAGNLQGSRWGVKGTEDLGGGLKAIFQLESGFNPNNGKMGSYGTGTKLFGRQAYVGVTHDAYGTFTVGRQYDPLVDLVQPLTADNYFGSTFTTPGDVDNNDNSSRTNNAIKYVSPVWSGFQFEGMYALGGVAGATGAGQSWAGAATWAGGPFSVAAGYFHMSNANTIAGRAGTWGTGVTSDGTFDGSNVNQFYSTAKAIDITSAAAQYVTGPFTFNIRYSFAQYKPDAFSGAGFAEQEKFHVAGAYAGYQVTPAMLIGLGYIYTHAAGDTSANYHQVSLGGDYNLSKRTDLYLVGAYQHASGHQRDASNGGAIIDAGASVGSYGYQAGSSNQEIISLGIRHKF